MPATRRRQRPRRCPRRCPRRRPYSQPLATELQKENIRWGCLYDAADQGDTSVVCSCSAGEKKWLAAASDALCCMADG
jgi:hypothetical protein